MTSVVSCPVERMVVELSLCPQNCEAASVRGIPVRLGETGLRIMKRHKLLLKASRGRPGYNDMLPRSTRSA